MFMLLIEKLSSYINYHLGKKAVRNRTEASSDAPVEGPTRSTPKTDKKSKPQVKVVSAQKEGSTKVKSKKIKKEPKSDSTADQSVLYEFEIEDPDSIERGKFSITLGGLEL